jgi:hypothetical protein
MSENKYFFVLQAILSYIYQVEVLGFIYALATQIRVDPVLQQPPNACLSHIQWSNRPPPPRSNDTMKI